MSEEVKQRPTRETDAALIVDAFDEEGDEYGTDIVPASLCRNMERRAIAAEQKLRLASFAERCRDCAGLPCELPARCTGYQRMVRIALRYRMERDEARDAWEVVSDMLYNSRTRLSRMVRIALWWRKRAYVIQQTAARIIAVMLYCRHRLTRTALRYRRERDEARSELAEMKASLNRLLDVSLRFEQEKADANSRADKSVAELDELRSLWSCEEPERLRSIDAWHAMTGSQGTPSIGGMVAFFRRECVRLRKRAEGAEAEVARLTLAGSLFASIAAWQRETFTKATAASCMAHLTRECGELADSVAYGDIDDTAEEAADCLLLLVGIADRAGFDLLQATENKLAKNKGRTWGKPDAQGVVEHVREDGVDGLAPAGPIDGETMRKMRSAAEAMQRMAARIREATAAGRPEWLPEEAEARAPGVLYGGAWRVWMDRWQGTANGK